MKKFLAIVMAAMLLLTGVSAMAATVDPAADRGIVPQGRNAEGKWDNNPVIEGENPVTGLPYDGEYIPILVNIDNVAAARPQWGIGEADIIYELPIDRLGMTRLTALYASVYPDRVGPVRSARVLHADLRQEWGAAHVFQGGQEAQGTNVFARFRKHGVYDAPFDLAFNLQGKTGSRFSSTVDHHSADHRHQLKMDELYQYLKDEAPDFTPRPYLFSDEDVTMGDDANTVNLDYGNGHSDSYFVYDDEYGNYARYMTKTGKPYVDMNNEEEILCFENIIVQWTDLSWYDGTGNRPVLEEVGEGNADIFMDGKHIAGYWVRSDFDSRTIFFDEEGNELPLMRGKTWISVASPKFLSVDYE